MRQLDQNIYFYEKDVSFKESNSINNELNTDSNEGLVENLVKNLVEGTIEHLTKSSDSINDKSVKSSAESFVENPIHSGNSATTGSQIRNSLGMEFVLVQAGEFEMGSPAREKRRKLWEGPVHRT